MRRSLILLLAACLLASLGHAAVPARTHPRECLVSEDFAASTAPSPFTQFRIQPQDDTTDLSKTPVTVTIAKDFSVEYRNSFKVVRNLKQSETYVLYHCGMGKPADSELPQDVDASTAKFFATPLHQVSAPDTTALGFLNVLGVQDRVKYYSKFAVDACWQRRIAPEECNKRAESAGSAFGPAPEGFANQETQIDAVLQFSASPSSKAIAFSATADPGVLARAEWIKMLSTFFNMEQVGNAKYEQVKEGYEATKAAAAAFLSSSGTAAQKVAWLYYQPGGSFGGSSYPEKIELKAAQFQADLMKDAGGAILDYTTLADKYADGTDITRDDATSKLTFLNMETVGSTLDAILADVDVIVDESAYPGVTADKVSISDVKARFKLSDSLKFVKSKAVIRLDAKSKADGSSAWFQEAVARPDEVLKDFVAAITPGALSAANRQPEFARSLGAFTPTLITKEQCPSSDACTVSPQKICPLLIRDCGGNVVAATAENRCEFSCPSKANLIVDFVMDDAKATAIATSTSNAAYTDFAQKTENVINSKLKGYAAQGQSKAYAVLSKVSLAARRRGLLAKTLKSEYTVTAADAASGAQAAADVSSMAAELSASDASGASFFGSAFDSTFGVQSTSGSAQVSTARPLRTGLFSAAAALLLALVVLL